MAEIKTDGLENANEGVPVIGPFSDGHMDDSHEGVAVVGVSAAGGTTPGDDLQPVVFICT